MNASLSSKRAALPIVGPALLDVVNMLQAYGAWTATMGPGWFRFGGFVHQCAAVTLFPEFWDSWHAAMEAAINGAPVEEATYSDAALWGLWPQAYPIAWDDDPAGFASRLVDFQQRLRVVVAGAGIAVPAQQGTWNPQAATPQPVSAAMGEAIAVLETNTATTVMGLLGLGGEAYVIPIFGWALAIVDAVIELAYAIFGTAQGVTHSYEEIPVGQQEAERWITIEAGTILMLRKLLDEYRRLSGTARSTVRVGSVALHLPDFTVHAAAQPQAEPAAHAAPLAVKSKLPQAVAIVGGTGLALVLLWILLA